MQTKELPFDCTHRVSAYSLYSHLATASELHHITALKVLCRSRGESLSVRLHFVRLVPVRAGVTGSAMVAPLQRG